MFTQTRPCPPPGSGAVLATVSDPFAPAAVAPAAPAPAAVEPVAAVDELLLDLNKLPNGFFDAGDAEGDALMAGEASAVAFDFLVRFAAGEADADASAAGDADSVAFALRPRFFASGEADASAAGDAAGDSDAVASAFLCDLCLAGEADAAGDGDSVWAMATLTPNVPIVKRRTSSFGCIT